MGRGGRGQDGFMGQISGHSQRCLLWSRGGRCYETLGHHMIGS